jgi:two-component system LytT family response regulator
MKVLLIDDEPHNCELLENLLHIHFPDEVEVIGHANSVDEATGILGTQKVDLVFLDVRMPGKNGFELLTQFPEPPFELVFITSYDQYALPAIQSDAVAYLLKPVDVQELKKAVIKARKMRLIRGLDQEDTPVVGSGLKIPVHEGDQVQYVPENEIVSLHAEGRYTRIYRSSGEQYLVARNLKTFEETVCKTSTFRRISRFVILNVAFVKSYSKSEPFTVILHNGEVFEVSRRKRTAILADLKAGR